MGGQAKSKFLINNGFEDLEKELAEMAKRISDPEVKRKALEDAGQLIVNRTKQILAPHRRTGMLEESISMAYVEGNKNLGNGNGSLVGGYMVVDGYLEIGWGGGMARSGKTYWGRARRANSAHGFYGRFLEHGFTHPWKGKHVQLPHLMPAFEAERERVLNIMLEAYKLNE